MDRFIPNRSASNLDIASYNVSRENRDVENLDALSPSKVRLQGLVVVPYGQEMQIGGCKVTMAMVAASCRWLLRSIS